MDLAKGAYKIGAFKQVVNKNLSIGFGFDVVVFAYLPKFLKT